MLMETYRAPQVKEVLDLIGIRVGYQSATDFFCYCPFHDNSSTPAFAISKTKGSYICYNPSCDERGSLIDLIRRHSEMNEFEIVRYLSNLMKDTPDTFDDDLAKLLDEKPEFFEFPQDVLDRLHADINDSAIEYFNSRGITLSSINYFQLGYSKEQNMVTVPVHSPDGMPVGLVGRSISEKKFKNSHNLPRNKTMFNLHRAKKESATLIVCESSFDAIRIHQAGFPNVVATLGGALSNDNVVNLNRYSSSIIIATDADEAGRKLGREIATKLKNKNIMWASFSEKVVYPHDAKDVGDLTELEIQTCIKNAISHYEYNSW